MCLRPANLVRARIGGVCGAPGKSACNCRSFVGTLGRMGTLGALGVLVSAAFASGWRRTDVDRQSPPSSESKGDLRKLAIRSWSSGAAGLRRLDQHGTGRRWLDLGQPRLSHAQRSIVLVGGDFRLGRMLPARPVGGAHWPPRYARVSSTRDDNGPRRGWPRFLARRRRIRCR